MTTIAVNAKVMRWAIERSNLSPDFLQRKFPKIAQWASEERHPTLRQLQSFAKTTSTPLGFFFLENPPDIQLPVPYFRTLGDDSLNKPSPDLLDTVRMMQQRQSWMREFLTEQGCERLSFVRSAKLGEQTRLIAGHIRRTLEFDEEWTSKRSTWTEALQDLRDAMEEAGILVIVNSIVGNNTHRKLNPGEFRGLVLVDEYAPILFVNGADAKAAQMFTIAHELAHVFFGSSAAFDLREMSPANDKVEKACNMVAAEFLVPENKLRQIWPSINTSDEPFQVLARRFKVSSLVAARRALDLKLINKSDFLEFYHAYQRDERRTSTNRRGGGDFYANQNLRVGRRFASTVIHAVKEGKLLYTEAYKLTGLYGKTFRRYASSLGIGGI